ncbi:probable purine permease 5, partial [Phtheirospermum japonicum]
LFLQNNLFVLSSEEIKDPPSPKSFWDKGKAFRTMAWNTFESKPTSHWILLTLSSLAMLVAFPASSLLSRVYYSNGGTSKWIIAWVAVAGWPIPALVLIPTYFVLGTSLTPLSLKLVASYVVLGFLAAADNLMYAYGYAYLPASTASLLGSTSLIFSALFGYLLVKNKINASTVNAVVLITAAMVIIALDSDSDRSFHVVLEQQVMVSLFGFVFTTIGLVASDGFRGMASEVKSFEGGRSWYLSVLIWGVVTFQLGVLGGTAVLFLASTVLAGVLNSIRVPLTSIAAVVLLSDPMSGLKILSLIITFWGFGSYIYGNYSS